MLAVGYHQRFRHDGRLTKSADIVHGDIKPENVLVSQADTGEYRAEVIDFGYSTILRTSGRVNMPRSTGWTAPEWPRRGGFEYQDALKMDVFSFGLPCLWLLCFDEQEHVPDEVFKNSPDGLYHLIAENARDIPDLRRFFSQTLKHDAIERDIDFAEICNILGSER
jgi:serine/threonine protein kinase